MIPIRFVFEFLSDVVFNCCFCACTCSDPVYLAPEVFLLDCELLTSEGTSKRRTLSSSDETELLNPPSCPNTDSWSLGIALIQYLAVSYSFFLLIHRRTGETGYNRNTGTDGTTCFQYEYSNFDALDWRLKLIHLSVCFTLRSSVCVHQISTFYSCLHFKLCVTLLLLPNLVLF